MADPNQSEPIRSLLAVWPGMGNVAVGAGLYLATRLDMKLVHELPPRDHFDLQHIEVRHGMIEPVRLPRSLIYEMRHPAGTNELLVFVGEAQPTNNRYAFCHRLLDFALDRGVNRLFTFASLATQLHPSQDPRVFCVATDRSLLEQMSQLEVKTLEEGQIGGLNGVFLAAGAERGVPGASLLGEIPFFAAGIPNPKASRAVLDTFATLAGLDIDTRDLAEQAKQVDEHLLQILERLTESAQSESGESPFPTFDPEHAGGSEHARDEAPEEPAPPTLDYASREHIERLFNEARQDRSRALHLKKELDRLGVFDQYEDRFLDLFKRAE